MQIELKRMQSQLDLTFVYVTHDQEEAMSMSDRIAVMSRGRIEQLDRPQVIYDRPASAFVAGFIGDMNFLEGQIADADGSRWSAQIGALIVHGLGDAKRGAHALIGVRPENVTIAAGPPAAGEVNEFAATLIAAMVLGDQVQLIAELPGGRQIVAREQRAAAGAAVEQLSAGDAGGRALVARGGHAARRGRTARWVRRVKRKRSFAPRYPARLTLPVLAYDAVFFLGPLAILVVFSLAKTVGFGQVSYALSGGNFRQLWDSLYSRHLQDDARDGDDRNAADAARRLSDGLLDGALPHDRESRSR